MQYRPLKPRKPDDDVNNTAPVRDRAATSQPLDPNLFSERLYQWLNNDQPKTLAELDNLFGEKSFAVAFMLLLFFPALPLPTGGISHVTEILAIILALQMIIGRRSLWLPQKLLHRSLGETTEKKVLPFMVKRIRWFQQFSRPRLGGILKLRLTRIFIGLIIIIFSLAAFFAVPFSGLDTLPSVGVVVIALAMLLDDIVLFLAGLGIGAIGTSLVIGSGAALGSVLRYFFQA